MASQRESVIVCRCEEVCLEDIETAIADGASTPLEVKGRTRAGMGVCQGRTCRALVADIVAQKTGLTPDNVAPFSYRPPVRPVPLEELALEGQHLGGAVEGGPAEAEDSNGREGNRE
ncbi:MAG: (2Fe-2S)-binding protein [Firmicutes bacterium]|nr:(2Fe-2S)-binding protein [Bacillota bacterium]